MSDIMLISKVRLRLQLHFVFVYRDSVRKLSGRIRDVDRR